MSSEAQARDTALYRFYGAADELLYVGITSDPGSRWKQHGADKPWWHEVTRTSIERYPTRAAALVVEKAVIRVSRPKYNRQHNGSAFEAVRPTVDPSTLIATCGKCNEVITNPKDGTLWIDGHEMHAHRQFRVTREAKDAEERKASSGWIIRRASLIPLHPRAPWRVTHYDCDPEDTSAYWIGLERVTTCQELLAWTGHLMEKTWLQDTDWNELCRAAGHGTGTRLRARVGSPGT